MKSSKSTAKNKAGTNIYHTKSYWQKTKTKIRNAFANNISKDIKHIKHNRLKSFNQVDFLGLC